MELLTIVEILLALFAGATVGYFYRLHIARLKKSSEEAEAGGIISEARKKAEELKREKILEAKEELQKTKEGAEKELRGRRGELQNLENRFLEKERNLDRKTDLFEKKESGLAKRIEQVQSKETDIEELYEKQKLELEKVSGLSMEEAKRLLMSNLENEVKYEASKMVKQIEDEAKRTAETKSREIVSEAIQRCAADRTAEMTVSVVNLPSDEMKGRIIGREGRNIRTLESLTGIDLIVDDTPEAVILSGFDPVRREIARRSLEKLISDGRIHPTRIEEVVKKTQKEMERNIREEGEQAAFDLGLQGISPDLLPLIGRLKFRTSFGQNVLQHSKEVAYLASVMASEIGADLPLVKRAGLLHDIGKSVDSEVEGAHAAIGADLLRRARESEAVVHAVEAHHAEVEPKTVEAILIQAADAISAARPGARRESLKLYVKRLEKLEEVATSFKGVGKAYAIQAGREVRIMVLSDEIDDAGAINLARDIARKIEQELEYPGQIKVTIIRETRVVEYAK